MSHSSPPLDNGKTESLQGDAGGVKATRTDSEPPRRSAAGAVGLISALTLLSRLLGLVREQVFAALLGAGLHADAFQIAFRIPNLLRDLFAEGALSAAFVPTYTRTLIEGGRPRANQLVSRLMTLLAIVLGLLVIVGIVLARPLVSAMAPGFGDVPGKAELTVRLTRVMLPFLPLVSFAAVAMGMLNAEERYGLPALAPALFNVVTIAWAAVLWSLGLPPDQVAFGWAVGTLLGGAAQFLVQVPGTWKVGWRFRPEWSLDDPGLRKIGSLMAPATMGLAAVQVNIFVNSVFASHQPGAVSWLNYAFRILYLPIGIFGVALGTIATTGLARKAAVGDMDGLRATLREALQMLAFLTLPATVGLALLGRPIVRLLYERGRFQAADTLGTAGALQLYALGLVAYTGVKVLAPAFYALGTPRVPLLASVSAVVTNLVLMVSLYPLIGYRGVALGTSVGALVNAGILLLVFQRRIGGLGGHGTGNALIRMAAAAALMGAVAWASWNGLESLVKAWPRLAAQATTALVPVAVGIVAYFGLAAWMGIAEVSALRRVLERVRSRVAGS